MEIQDAAGLTQLSASVEDVFASGDLPRAAETLANMRHCLSAVGEVTILFPFAYYGQLSNGRYIFINLCLLRKKNLCLQVAEFANVRKQLEVLEDRLEEMVQPRLSDALSNRKVFVRFLRSILCA